MKGIAVVVFCILLSSCFQKQKEQVNASPHCEAYDSLIPQYSRSFKAYYYDGFTVLQVMQQQQVPERYVLVPAGKKMPIGFEQDVRINTPVTSVAVNSSTFISLFEACGALPAVKAVTDAAFVFNERIRQRLAANEVADIGTESGLNYEKLLLLKPDFVMLSGYEISGSLTEAKLKQLQIPRVLNFDFAEAHPLARAEWIKFAAVLTGKEEAADSVFGMVQAEYDSLRRLVQQHAKQHPTVFFNLPWKEIWYMPSAETYMAHLAEDAGADFVWKHSAKNNSLNLSLSFEEVLKRAQHTDYWLHPNSVNSRADMLQSDPRFVHYDAFKSKHVYNNNLQGTPAGGNNFWERGTVYPNEVLADLIAIFHPQLVPGHRLKYYKQLP